MPFDRFHQGGSRKLLGFVALTLLACGTSNRTVSEGSGGAASGAAGSGGASGTAGNLGTSGGNAGGNGGADAGGSAGNAGTNGNAGNAGASAGGDTGNGGSAGASGSAGTTGAMCTPACTAPQICNDGTCVDCLNDDTRCDPDNTPSKCVNNVWTPQTPCGGQMPACSGGVCAAAKLLGGIVTVGTPVLSGTSVRLVDHGLEYTPTICGTVNSQMLCLSGGIRP
jgi:hypothetical protein